MEQPLFLQPVFKEMIWGGNLLREKFGYPIPGDDTGECWAISGHPNGDCTVVTRQPSEVSGLHLSKVWKTHQELFGGKKGVPCGRPFPLLTKILDAKQDLSIQVHPDDAYAAVHENGSLGKTECWYVLDCKEDATIVIGHNAADKQELRKMIEEKRFHDLIREIPIRKGDFFFIGPGTVHAIKGGTMILETQQSSDVTYRLYDYDRLQNGKPRQLHLAQCMDVIRCPYVNTVPEVRPEIRFDNGSCIRNLAVCSLFGVNLVRVSGELSARQDQNFLICSVIEGSGAVNGFALKKGDHFILPAEFGQYTLRGDMQLITSWEPRKD